MHHTTGNTDEAPIAKSTSNTLCSTRQLVAAFWLWKCLLLLVALASPGPGYDTSTHILLSSSSSHPLPSGSWLEPLVLKLTRWDAIYFVTASQRGHIFEQESAFSLSFARVTSAITRVFPFDRIEHALIRHASAGIALSHISHFLAVLLLYRLTYEIVPGTHGRKGGIAFTAACLHVVSPAGLFLSASYGESSFALANFAGMLCYVFASKHHHHDVRTALSAAAWTTLSGALFGIATTIRSNGLLSGTILAWDAVLFIPNLLTIIRHQDRAQAIRLGGILVGGCLTALGYILPQLEAYLTYCTEANTRTWCTQTPPSIYTFVQQHYWNVGFLHYWTVSNLPLFLLATPMLLILTTTSWTATSSTQHLSPPPDSHPLETRLFQTCLSRFALPQTILALLALTTFHVQIINRISSGYPVWYMMLAMGICENSSREKGRASVLLGGDGEGLVRAAVVYAVVQGGLFASFMPPA